MGLEIPCNPLRHAAHVYIATTYQIHTNVNSVTKLRELSITSSAVTYMLINGLFLFTYTLTIHPLYSAVIGIEHHDRICRTQIKTKLDIDVHKLSYMYI